MEKTTKTLEMIKRVIGKSGQISPSPFMNWLQPVAVDAKYGSLSFEYTIRKEMTNPVGILHGGVVAGIMDDMMGATIYSMELAGQYVTVNLDVNFFASAALNDHVVARTNVIKKGKKIVNIDCELWLKDKDKLLAKGNSNLIRTGN